VAGIGGWFRLSVLLAEATLEVKLSFAKLAFAALNRFNCVEAAVFFANDPPKVLKEFDISSN
jgi:hypothetical protein